MSDFFLNFTTFKLRWLKLLKKVKLKIKEKRREELQKKYKYVRSEIAIHRLTTRLSRFSQQNKWIQHPASQ